MSISMDLDTKIEANQAFPSSKSTYFKNLFSHNARSNKECRHIKIVTPSSGHILKAIINMDWEDLKNAVYLIFQKRSHEKIVKRVLREKNCWKKKV